MYQKLTLFDFGKYKGIPVWAVAVSYPTYIDWCIKNIETFAIEDLESLQELPLIHIDKKSPESISLSEQLKANVAKNPLPYECSLTAPYDITEYLKDKGYNFYLVAYKPFLTTYHKYSEEVLALNTTRVQIRNRQQQRIDSAHYRAESSEERNFEKYNGAYGLDDETIDNAFEGDPENYWNIE